MIEVKRYYRPNELPDGVYLPLMQDRLIEISITQQKVNCTYAILMYYKYMHAKYSNRECVEQ